MPRGGAFAGFYQKTSFGWYNCIYMTCGRRVNILGVDVDMDCSIEDVIEKIERAFLQDGNHYICTTNPEFIMAAQGDPAFKDMINNADMSLADGSGVVMADYYQNRMRDISASKAVRVVRGLAVGVETAVRSFTTPSRFSPKVTGVELSKEIFRLSAEKGYSVFLLGGMPRNFLGNFSNDGTKDVASAAADYAKSRYSGVNIVGASSKFSYKEVDDGESIQFIQECMKNANIEHLDFLLVAYGQKKQEAWIARNMKKIPCRVAVGVGGTFDYLSGVAKMPNDKLTKLNLEWLFRLFTQPWRFSRIVRAFPLFPLTVFLDSLR